NATKQHERESAKIGAPENGGGRDGSHDAEGAAAREPLGQKDRDDGRLWKEAGVAPADGITFSGKHTEGAPTQRHSRRHEVLPCGMVLLSFIFDWRGPPTSGGAHERSASKGAVATHAAL